MVQVIAVLGQLQDGVGLPVGEIGKKHVKTGRVQVVDAGASLSHFYDDLPVGEGNGLPGGPHQSGVAGQDLGAVGEGHGGSKTGLGEGAHLLQAAVDAGPAVEGGGVALHEGKGDHAVHLGEAGELHGGHLGLEVVAGAGLVEQQLRCRPLLGQAVELEAGLLLGAVEPQVDGAASRGVEGGGDALPGEAVGGQPPEAGPGAGLVAQDQEVALPVLAQHVDLPLCVGGGEQIAGGAPPGAEDGEALTPRVPEEQGGAGAQKGQDQHKDAPSLQMYHTAHLVFRRVNHRLARPSSREHQRRTKFLCSRAS